MYEIVSDLSTNRTSLKPTKFQNFAICCYKYLQIDIGNTNAKIPY